MTSKHQRCVANFSEIVKGFGMFPNKILQKVSTAEILQNARVGTAVPCLATPLVNLQQKLIFAKIAECTYTCCACNSPFLHNSKCHFLKWKSAATAALSAQKRNGRTLSMAAKPFILTVDSVRLFCYPREI